MKHEILLTNDGSVTLFDPALNETYHSIHGAVQEALHVFIRNGLNYFEKGSALNIFEVGFGTGLNALLTYQFASEESYKVNYATLEAYPIDHALIGHLNYTTAMNRSDLSAVFEKLHASSWNEYHHIGACFKFKKIHERIESLKLESNTYDVIYYDAFGPRAQAEMWSRDLFVEMFDCLREGGVLVTYCAKGQVKRDLRSVGFFVQTLPGPPGKREMTRAIKK